MAAIFARRRRRRSWAHVPVIHAASHVDHKKELFYFYAYMWFCCYNYGAPFGGAPARRSSAIN